MSEKTTTNNNTNHNSSSSVTTATTSLPFGLTSATSLEKLSDAKLARFVVGHTSKSKFQRDKDARAAKKKREDAEAVSVYASFVKSFEEHESEDENDVVFHAAGQKHAPRRMLPIGNAARGGGPTKKLSEMDRMLLEMQASSSSDPNTKSQAVGERVTPKKEDPTTTMASSSTTALPKNTLCKSGKKRVWSTIDDVMHELSNTKHVESTLPSSHFYESGSKTTVDDATTTNLYVGNIHPMTTEEMLSSEFNHYGQVKSVKIMWPRTEEEIARRRNCGFVNFYTREDAQRAKNDMQECCLNGNILVVGWGKAVKSAASHHQSSSFAASRIASHSLSGPNTHTPLTLPLHKVYTAGKMPGDTSDRIIEIVRPSVASECRLIDRLASFVARDGVAFEKAVMARERDNPIYTFLFTASPSRQYYRYAVYSAVMTQQQQLQHPLSNARSSSSASWLPPPPTDPFQMSYQGPFVQAPPQGTSSDLMDGMTQEHHGIITAIDKNDKDNEESVPPSGLDKTYMTGQQLARARVTQRGSVGHYLSLEEVKAFKHSLVTLEVSSQSIAQVMGAAMDHSESAEAIVSFVLASLTSTCQSTIKTKQENARGPSCSPSLGVTAAHDLALLYLVSDILHNSSTARRKNATVYRSLFQKVLPTLLEHLSRRKSQLTGRLSASNYTERILRVLSVWEGWCIFSPVYSMGLEATFRGHTNDNDNDNDKNDNDNDKDDNTEGQKKRHSGTSSEFTSRRSSNCDLDRETLARKCTTSGLYVTESDTVDTLVKKCNVFFSAMTQLVASRETLGADNAAEVRTAAQVWEEQCVDCQILMPRTIKGNDSAPQDVITATEEEEMDGVPMSEEEDNAMDGEPMSEEEDDAMDGAPMSEDDEQDEKDDIDGEVMSD